MISHFVKIMDDLELFHQKTQKNRLVIRFFSGNMSKPQDSTTFLVHVNHRWLFEKYFWFQEDLLIIFHFVKIMDRWEFFHEKNTKNPLRSEDFLGQFNRSKNVKILEFQKVELWKDNDFLRWFLIFSCISWSKIVMKRRGQDPQKVKILEAPRIIQKVLEYDRGP